MLWRTLVAHRPWWAASWRPGWSPTPAADKPDRVLDDPITVTAVYRWFDENRP
jgi:hypothetical protein